MPQVHRAFYLVGLAIVGGVALLASRRKSLGRSLASLRRYSAPSVGAYESSWSRLLGGFYRRVARETADLAASGKLLDIGSGTGHLAVALSREYPELRVVGVDISPEMVGQAREVAQQAGVGARVMFEVGDAGALPFPDASFDAVLSTLSMHHWPDPARGLAEIHRVLRPNGVARIYDVAGWVLRLGRRESRIADLATASSFEDVKVESFVRLGPIPIVRRIELRRAAQPREGPSSP